MTRFCENCDTELVGEPDDFESCEWCDAEFCDGCGVDARRHHEDLCDDQPEDNDDGE